MSDNIYHTSHKYINWYISLIRKAQNRTSIDGYFEKHHVFPKSIFGNNDFVVNLTAREHFIAHKLLYKIYLLRYGSDHKFTIYMLKAITYMATREEIRNNSRMYDECRRAASLAMSGENNPSVKYGFSEEHRRKLSERGKGRPHSEEHKNNLRLASKKRLEKYGFFFSEETRQKSLISRLNKSKRFNFWNDSLKILEPNLTAVELTAKYDYMKLDASSLRKFEGKNKNGTSKMHKGWTIIDRRYYESEI
jgi:hypothetical protein